MKGQEINIESMSTEELKEEVLRLPNVDLSTESDWNDDLKIALQKKSENEFSEAIKKMITPDLPA